MFHFGVKVVLSKYFGAKVSLVLGYMDPRDTSTRVGYLPGPQRDKGLCLRLYRVLGIMFLDQTFSHVWLRLGLLDSGIPSVLSESDEASVLQNGKQSKCWMISRAVWLRIFAWSTLKLNIRQPKPVQSEPRVKTRILRLMV